MSEFRQNLATKEWVIIAGERGERPRDYSSPDDHNGNVPQHREDCPFCVGNEEETGEELLQIGEGKDWSIRSVRNKYSALYPDRSVERQSEGRFLKSDSYGHAEVIIESPRHDATLATLTQSELEELIAVYRLRLAAISRLPNISIAMLFRNYGSRAGTSLEHPHTQIIASPIIPPHIRDPFQKAALHYDSYGTCVYCDMVEEERRQATRMVYENEHYAVFCPFAARTPYELRIYPKRHNACFFWSGEHEIPALAQALSRTLRALHRRLGSPSYNMLLRTSPVGDEDVRYLHWYMVIVPRISTPAGFEMGSGIYINTVAPEQSAEELREMVG
ncbi:galactose-1-phosphate uridylyltransferase [bacterium]|nr:galactose-1-phosphate uridylyltransferase [bacterium]